MTIISQPDIFCHIIKFQRQKNSKLFWFTVPVLVKLVIVVTTGI